METITSRMTPEQIRTRTIVRWLFWTPVTLASFIAFGITLVDAVNAAC